MNAKNLFAILIIPFMVAVLMTLGHDIAALIVGSILFLVYIFLGIDVTIFVREVNMIAKIAIIIDVCVYASFATWFFSRGYWYSDKLTFLGLSLLFVINIVAIFMPIKDNLISLYLNRRALEEKKKIEVLKEH
ncbi:MAG TPA: hypothetical protein VJZ24_04095 [Thermodesulfovibrionales bacterium]|nr:hypothetical protein [Thermodesulfovibrionales bacterium]